MYSYWFLNTIWRDICKNILHWLKLQWVLYICNYWYQQKSAHFLQNLWKPIYSWHNFHNRLDNTYRLYIFYFQKGSMFISFSKNGHFRRPGAVIELEMAASFWKFMKCRSERLFTRSASVHKNQVNRIVLKIVKRSSRLSEMTNKVWANYSARLKALFLIMGAH